jgi:hypothetical protein
MGGKRHGLEQPKNLPRVEPRGIEPLTSALPARVALVHGGSWERAIGGVHPHR